MKNYIKYVITILLIICCIFLLTTTCFAQNAEEAADEKITGFIKPFPSKIIAEPKFDIEEVIKNKVTESAVNFCFEMYNNALKTEIEYTYDPAVYIVKYGIWPEFWDEVETLDYEGITDALYSEYPTIFIPFFADIADADGNVSKRQCGNLKLHYDSLTKEYTLGYFASNVLEPDFINKKIAGDYEAIAEYLTKNSIDAKNVILIQYAFTATGETDESIVLIDGNTDKIIVDMTDTLHNQRDSYPYYETRAYTVAEYIPLRKEIDKELNKTVDSWEKVQFGGNALSTGNDAETNWTDIIIYFVAFVVIIAITVLTVFIVKKRDKNHLES